MAGWGLGYRNGRTITKVPLKISCSNTGIAAGAIDGGIGKANRRVDAYGRWHGKIGHRLFADQDLVQCVGGSIAGVRGLQGGFEIG